MVSDPQFRNEYLMNDFAVLARETDKLSYQHEFVFKGEPVKAGRWIKFRNQYEPVVFVRMVHHTSGVTWIECHNSLQKVVRLHPSKMEGVLFKGRMEKNGNGDRGTRPLR